MKEVNSQQFFRQWIKKNPPKETQTFEYKICKAKSLPFSRVEEHQEFYLTQSKDKGFYYKLSDLSAGIKPFDAVWIKAEKAFIIIHFYKIRVKNVMYMIEIEDWLLYKNESKKQSITEEECEEIAYKVINFKK